MEETERYRPSRGFRAVFERCCDVMMRITEFLLFSVMAIVTYEVVARYIFKSPTLWVVDVSRYCLVYITFLGAANFLLKGEHINVDLLLIFVSERVRAILNIMGHVICAVAFLVFLVFTSLTTWDNYTRGILVIDPIEIPKFIPLAIIPIGTFFLLVAAMLRVADFIGHWRVLRRGRTR